MQQPSIYCRDGFLDFDDPPHSWGEFNRLSIASAFNLSSLHFHPSIASSFLIALHYTCLPLLFIGSIPPSSNYAFLLSTQSVFNLDTISAIYSIYSYDITSHTLAYKPVAKKVYLMITPVDEKFCVT